MSKCIDGIEHDAVGSLAIHKPSKSFGDLFEEKKVPLETLQAGLASAVLPKTPPMPAVEYRDFGIGVDFHKTLLPHDGSLSCSQYLYGLRHYGEAFTSINTFLTDPPALPLRPSIRSSMLLV
ncbi:hypothetical protein [Porphyromonas sp. oral taxon 275]|uniref:hypothetical protein n=1 Tax=Porphyromonas sp. oral taxon 275 TaxID=712435 RepID=UPI001BA691AD|nr:hypothetical protein [Porphyromonas sp. oral taxon 275]QUB42341.1 hypothetical protein J4862_04845 [Porphyromonas sp. oral taxon 275]